MENVLSSYSYLPDKLTLAVRRQKRKRPRKCQVGLDRLENDSLIKTLKIHYNYNTIRFRETKVFGKIVIMLTVVGRLYGLLILLRHC